MASGQFGRMRGRRLRAGTLALLAIIASCWGGSLAKTCDDETAARFLQELGHQDAKVRERAAYELGKLRPDQAAWVERLIAAAEDVEPQVRRGAVWALGQVQVSQDQAVQKLLAVLASDVLPQNRSEAVQALGSLGSAAKEAVPALESVVRGGRGIHGVDPFLPTRRMLPLKYNVHTRSEAIRALGQIGSEEAIGLLAPLLIQAEKELNGEGLPYYVLSAEALARIGRADSRIMPALQRGRRLPATTEQLRAARLAADRAVRQIEAQEASRPAVSEGEQRLNRP